MTDDVKPEISSIYRDLKVKIIGGTIVPGTALVEGSLATEYQVSRSPIREALSRLTFEGLVERHDRALRVRMLRAEEVLELYEVRLALEAAAARAAAQRRTDRPCPTAANCRGDEGTRAEGHRAASQDGTGLHDAAL